MKRIQTQGLEQCLTAFNNREEGAIDALIEQSYTMLLRMAKSILKSEQQSRLLEPMDLVHKVFEAVQREQGQIENFKAYARAVMKNVILAKVRDQHRLKRHGKERSIHSFLEYSERGEA